MLIYHFFSTKKIDQTIAKLESFSTFCIYLIHSFSSRPIDRCYCEQVQVLVFAMTRTSECGISQLQSCRAFSITIVAIFLWHTIHKSLLLQWSPKWWDLFAETPFEWKRNTQMGMKLTFSLLIETISRF